MIRPSSRRSSKKLPFLAITLGDPAGIGPWVAADAALHPAVRARCRPVLVGDASVVSRHVVRPGLKVRPITDLDGFRPGPRTVNVLHVPHPRIRELVLGRPQRLGGEAASLAVHTAAALAMQRRVAAVVTGPVSKESFKLAGVRFPGHTEMLEALSGVRGAEMVMAAGPLLALLLTRHLPLKRVPGSLSKRLIVDSVRRVDTWMRKSLRLARPRWALCGLNPHAGDNGLLGSEERRIVAPAAAALRKAGVRVDGPAPADVAWARHAAGEYDAVACLYHDQGMIPLKTLYPKKVVNITAGLPWVRTSPGHGTAFDLAAAKYRAADATATVEAALWALRISGN